MAFSEKLREARKKKHMTQQQVADILGISKSAYCWYESGRREPDLERVWKLSELLDISTDALLGDGAESAKRPVSEADIKAAFFGGETELSPDDLDILWADVQDYAAYKLQLRKKDRG